MLERQCKEKLCGCIDLDDAYLGGERPGKRGRGSENKIPFLAAVETRDEKPVRINSAVSGAFASPKSPATFERVSPRAARSSPTDWAVSPAWLTQAAGTHSRDHWRRPQKRETEVLPVGQHPAGEPQEPLAWNLPFDSQEAHAEISRRI